MRKREKADREREKVGKEDVWVVMSIMGFVPLLPRLLCEEEENGIGSLSHGEWRRVKVGRKCVCASVCLCLCLCLSKDIIMGDMSDMGAVGCQCGGAEKVKVEKD